MPTVGNKKFPYTPSGEKAAASYASKTGKPETFKPGKGGGDATHRSLSMQSTSNASFKSGAGAGKQPSRAGSGPGGRRFLRDAAGNYSPGTSATGRKTSGLGSVGGGTSARKSAKPAIKSRS